MAVVLVPPVATICNAHGTVYERVSGQTISVREPLRLAAMFERGDAARRGALARASAAAQDAMLRIVGQPAHADDHAQFGLGISAAGYLPDIASRLFSPALSQGVISSMTTVMMEDAFPPQPKVWPEMTQDSCLFEALATHHMGMTWSVRITWDGAIGVSWVQPLRNAQVTALVTGPVRRAWTSADEMLDLLGPRGPQYLTLTVAGAGSLFPPNPKQLPQWGAERPRLPVVSRGPLGRGVDPEVLASVERELRRVTRETVYEPTS